MKEILRKFLVLPLIVTNSTVRKLIEKKNCKLNSVCIP